MFLQLFYYLKIKKKNNRERFGFLDCSPGPKGNKGKLENYPS